MKDSPYSSLGFKNMIEELLKQGLEGAEFFDIVDIKCCNKLFVDLLLDKYKEDHGDFPENVVVTGEFGEWFIDNYGEYIRTIIHAPGDLRLGGYSSDHFDFKISG